LTVLHRPNVCWACLAAHSCNILIWAIWLFSKNPVREKEARSNERLALLIFAPISMVAFFSCLNLTFMAYGFNNDSGPKEVGLRSGEPIPLFSAQTIEGRLIESSAIAGGPIEREQRIILDFVSLNCPYSKEQMKILEGIPKKSRWICVTPSLNSEIVQNSIGAEWVEDRDYRLHKLFKVKGYPTLFVLGRDGKIDTVIPGVPAQFKEGLSAFLE
jgi:hypothetical protein